MTYTKPFRFRLGGIAATPGALEALGAVSERAAVTYLLRHARGDWGEVDAHDTNVNNHAARNGLRVLSAYTLPTGVKIWIVTEADRSATTILLPGEY